MYVVYTGTYYHRMLLPKGYTQIPHPLHMPHGGCKSAKEGSKMVYYIWITNADTKIYLL